MKKRLLALAMAGGAFGILAPTVVTVSATAAHACPASSQQADGSDTIAGPVYGAGDPTTQSGYVGVSGTDPSGTEGGYVEANSSGPYIVADGSGAQSGGILIDSSGVSQC